MFRRQTRLFQRPLAEKFWAPFNQRVTGYDLNKYALKSTMNTIADPSSFSCQVNGACGGQNVAEDFFLVLLSGFDVHNVNLYPGNDTDKVVDGSLSLIHERPFISWRPAATQSTCNSNMVNLPFKMHLECNDGYVSHLTLNTPLADSLVAAGCPEEIANMTNNPEAMKMFTALRRVKVKPELITLNALMSASKTQPQWSSALGIL